MFGGFHEAGHSSKRKPGARGLVYGIGGVGVTRFSHLDEEGAARMVDVGEKAVIRRTATAGGRVEMSPKTVDLLREKALPKGDALNTAKIAGVMAAKRTPELIPLCHGLNLTTVDLEFTVGDDGVEILALARASDRTGVEMEALTAVSVAALTLYDMCKAVDKGMVIGEVRLLEKTKEEGPS
jgi:cyclic pyranopterin monophosphate synthase